MFLSVLLLVPTSGAAQTAETAAPLEAPAPRIEFEHDGLNVTGFVLYATPEGGVPLAFDLGPLRPDNLGRVSVAVPMLPDGVYLIEVAGYNAGGEGPRARANPATVVVSGGQVTPRAEGIAARPAAAPASPRAAPAPAPRVRQEPSATKPGGKRGGVFGKIWRGVIGSDN